MEIMGIYNDPIPRQALVLPYRQKKFVVNGTALFGHGYGVERAAQEDLWCILVVWCVLGHIVKYRGGMGGGVSRRNTTGSIIYR